MVNIKVKNTKYYLKSLKYHQPPRAWSASKNCKNLRQAQRFRRHCSTLYKSKLMHLKNIHEQDKWCCRRLSGFNLKDSSPARPSVPHWPPTFYTITFLCMVSTLKTCNAVLVNPAWSVAPVRSMHTIFTLKSKNHIYPKILFLCELLWLHL